MTATIEGTTFKPGDRVRVVKGSDYGNLHVDLTGEVTRVWDDFIDFKRDDSGETDDGWFASRFELVPTPEPEPFDPTGYVVVDREPKVGDRVVSRYTERTKAATRPEDVKYDGPGTVEGIGSYFIYVVLDGLGEIVWFDRSEFDIVEKAKPQVGDVVKHDAGTVYLPAGATGDVTHVWGDGMVHVKWHDRSKQWSDGGFWSSGLTVVKRPEPKPLAPWEFALLHEAAADSGIFGTVEDEVGLRALGKGAVIVSSVNGAEYVRVSDNEYRATFERAFTASANYATNVFGAIRNGNFTFLVLHPGI